MLISFKIKIFVNYHHNLKGKFLIYMQTNKIYNVVLMSKFIQHFLSARHVSDLIGPSSGVFCTSCIRRLWYVVIRVLLDTSSRYFVTDEVRNMSS